MNKQKSPQIRISKDVHQILKLEAFLNGVTMSSLATLILLDYLTQKGHYEINKKEIHARLEETTQF